MASDISVLLTSFQRPRTLLPQVQAILRQTLQPDAVVVFHNGPLKLSQTEVKAKCTGKGVRFVEHDWNTGVWTRFAWCLYGFATRFVCVFDDDTIPGSRWLENCHMSFLEKPGLYGACGVRFPYGTRSPREYVGTGLKSDKIERVDIVGHSWFFERAILGRFCSEVAAYASTAGEDYCLSYHHDGRVYVPPQPENEPELWGSTKVELGQDTAALYRRPGEEEKKQKIHDAWLALGWKPMAKR